MTARTKLEELTYSWYGYSLVAALVTLLTGGFGVFSIFIAAAFLAFRFVVTFLIGRALVKKSGLMRFAMLCVSVVGMALGPVLAFMFFKFSFSGLISSVMWIAHVGMAYRSFSTLREPTVRSYFA